MPSFLGGKGLGGFSFNKIPGFLKAKNFMLGAPQDYGRSGGLFSKLKGLSGSTKGILGLGAGAGLLGGLFAKQEDETEEEYQARIEQLATIPKTILWLMLVIHLVIKQLVLMN